MVPLSKGRSLLHPIYPSNIASASNLPKILNLDSYTRSFSSGNRPSPKGNRFARVGMLGASAVALAGKTKYFVGILKLTKLSSLASMVISCGAYSMFFGFPYAAGMVGLLLIHESGHALAMHQLGLPFGPMLFVPFLGASVTMKKLPRDAYQEALVAFGGPALGTLGAFGTSIAAGAMDSQLLYALADFGYMINLFNMLPIGMMDGGRITSALSPYSGLAGLGIGGGLIYGGVVSNPIFYLVMMSGGYSTFQRLYYGDNDLPVNYYKITNGQRAGITAGYFGLIGTLIAGMGFNAKWKMSPQQLQTRQQDEWSRSGGGPETTFY